MVQTEKQNDILLSYSDVCISRKEYKVVEFVTFTLRSGELNYLIGKVGSGKSTIMKSIYADLPIASGSAHFASYDLMKIKRCQIPYLRREIGIIFQDFQLIQEKNVEDNLKFVLRATGWRDRTLIRQRIKEVLTEVGMEDKGYKFPHELSGGEQQRVVISRALLNKPKLILADEPTGNLDPYTSEQIVNLLSKITKEGTAVLMSTHNYGMIKRYPGRIFKIEDHRITEMVIRQDDNVSGDLM